MHLDRVTRCNSIPHSSDGRYYYPVSLLQFGVSTRQQPFESSLMAFSSFLLQLPGRTCRQQTLPRAPLAVAATKQTLLQLLSFQNSFGLIVAVPILPHQLPQEWIRLSFRVHFPAPTSRLPTTKRTMLSWIKTLYDPPWRHGSGHTLPSLATVAGRSTVRADVTMIQDIHHANRSD